MDILCQSLNIKPGNVEKNKDLILNAVRQAKNEGAQVLLLSPLCLTGVGMKSGFDFSFFIDLQFIALDYLKQNMESGIACITTVMKDNEEVPVLIVKDKWLINPEPKDFNGEGFENINLCTQISQVKSDKTNFLMLTHKWLMGSGQELKKALKGTRSYFVTSSATNTSSHFVSSSMCGTVQGDVGYISCGTAMINENTKLAPLNFELMMTQDKFPFVPLKEEYLNEAIEILKQGLINRLNHVGTTRVVIGISGGLDSTLCLLIAYSAIKDKKDILGITMPGFGTGDRTKNNAIELMDKMGITALNIPIREACEMHFKDIGQEKGVYNLTFENAQARERMQILFDYSNKISGINLGTGDLSESMLGFTTFGGDHLSMYSVNGGVPKTLVKALVEHFAKLYPKLKEELLDIANTPISPELLPLEQHTESIVGKYMYNDFAIFHTVINKCSPKELKEKFERVFGECDFDFDLFYKRIVNAQFKRSCCADFVQVTKADIRGDFALPTDCYNIYKLCKN